MASLLDLYSRLGSDAVNGATAAGKGLMDLYERPVVDRFSMLPIGQHADGSLTLAWPGFVKDAYDSVVNSYFDVAQGRTPQTSDVLTVASTPVMGNLAGRLAGAIPDGALGVGASKPPTGGIRAFHGSPHDFDRFDMSKIGTGEGAQAYGHGLYFAENEGVAKSYKGALSDNPFSDGDPRHGAWLVKNFRGDEAARKYLADSLPADQVDDAVEQVLTADSGRMYEVRINAEPEQFLDWDKPLSQQSEGVRRALEPIASAEAERLAGADRVAAAKARAMGIPFSQPALDPMALTGADLAMAAGVRESGIPGIRYLDQGSRGAGDGSHNYVVFDDALIDILRKYGLLGMVGGGAALAGSGTDAQSAP